MVEILQGTALAEALRASMQSFGITLNHYILKTSFHC